MNSAAIALFLREWRIARRIGGARRQAARDAIGDRTAIGGGAQPGGGARARGTRAGGGSGAARGPRRKPRGGHIRRGRGRVSGWPRRADRAIIKAI